MPRGSQILGQPINEEKWSRAKERAAEEGHTGDYAYIMDIYKKMSHLGEFKREHVAERRKKKQKLPAWRERRWDQKTHALKTKTAAVKKALDHDHLKLALMRGAKGDLDEFRCGACGVLLFKGMNLAKAQIEVKCRGCRKLLVSNALVVVE